MLNPTFVSANKGIFFNPTNKGIFFNPTNKSNLAESKLSYNIKISNNSSTRCIPKHVNVNRDRKLLWGHDADYEIYLSTVCTDNNGLLYSQEKKYCLTKHSLDNRSIPIKKPYIAGSCNGILCLGSSYGPEAALWNPVTDELKSLPPSSIEYPPEAADSMWFTIIGFGFDARSEDFKALRFVQNKIFSAESLRNRKRHTEQLYSLKNDSWRPIVNPKVFMDGPYSTSLNGSCYMCSSDCVLSFDFVDDAVSKSLAPKRGLDGSCNGILCLEDLYGSENAVLWNPVTDELKSLPPSSIECPPEADRLFRTSGFGFDARSNDYKVLRFVKNGFFHDDGYFNATTHHFELYSLKNDSWRPIANPLKYPSHIYSVSLNGSCYWGGVDCVLSFDFADEVFSYLPLPVVIKPGEPRKHFFFDIDGSTLGSIVFPCLGDDKRFDLWVWKSNEWCWNKVDSFVLGGVVRPLGFWGRDKCLLRRTNNQMLLFDLTIRLLQPLDIRSEILVSFVESTVSIKGHSKAGELHTQGEPLDSNSL